jgi:hypothetical protein
MRKLPFTQSMGFGGNALSVGPFQHDNSSKDSAGVVAR